uniref:Putative plastid-lipid-associated protein 10ic n=1 Tax=Rhizophora mucronata TaxID=61149 RepID=A0A2P2LN47_RHIMU
MNVALSTFLYPVSLSRGRSKSKPDLNYSRKLSTHKKFSCSVTLATQTAQVSGFDLENKKHDVLRAVQDTQRGLVASADQRSTIEEALVCSSHYLCSNYYQLSLVCSVHLTEKYWDCGSRRWVYDVLQ